MNSLTLFFKNITTGKKVVLLLTPIISTLLSMKTILLGLIILILVDLLTGMKKTLHNKSVAFNPLRKEFWKAIKSYLLRKTWRKAYEYGIGIIVICVFETMVFGVTPIVLVGKAFTISELAVLIPCSVEVWSIFENMEEISGNNILKKIKGFLPEKLVKLLEVGKKDEEDK